MKIRYFILQTLFLLTITLFSSNQSSSAFPAVNAGLNLADPTIFQYQGTYYLYGTSSDKGFLVYQSKDLKTWTGPAGKSNGFALAKGDAFGDKGFWAPQVFRYKAKFYMAYTANEQIAIAESDSPLGPFTQDSPKAITATGKQIDPFVFFDTNGKPYIYQFNYRKATGFSCPKWIQV
jgi:xylan 1,4-beta-xylosidase